MKLNISYYTKEKIQHNEMFYCHVEKHTSLEAISLFRQPCGREGKARERYYYWGVFKAPNDAQFHQDGLIKKPINRKKNKHFNPKHFEFVDNKCEVVENEL
jgi:hypothetical protein